jgi:hypothetical protein
MIDIEVGGKYSVNIEALDETLRENLGEVYNGLKLSGGVVTLRFLDHVTKEQISLGQQLVDLHQPEILTDKQSEQLIKRQQLDWARRDLKDIDLDKLDPLTRWLLLEVTRLAEKFPD